MFWHRHYVRLLSALATGQAPPLPAESYPALNTRAYREFQSEAMPALAARLARYQRQVDRLRRSLPNPTVEFPLKQGSSCHRADDWIPRIAAHIRGHVLRLRRAERRRSVLRATGIRS